jgi:hypothetical protein
MKPIRRSLVGQVLFGTFFTLMLTIGFVPEGFTQQPMRATVASVAPATAELKSLCNPATIKPGRAGATVTYVCEGKMPTAKPAAMGLKAPTGGGVKATIGCTYSQDSQGNNTWTGCTCTADAESNCNSFINWCAEQGDNVGGNSGGASCAPGG